MAQRKFLVAIDAPGITQAGTQVALAGVPRTATLAYVSPVTWDASQYDMGIMTLGGNVTMGFANGSNGQMFRVRIKQGSPGGFTLTLTGCKLGTDLTAVTLSTAVGATDYLGVVYNSDTGNWDVVSFARGF